MAQTTYTECKFPHAIGDTVEFGNFAVGVKPHLFKAPTPIMKPISWKVLDVRDGMGLLLAERSLDVKELNVEDGGLWPHCTKWEDCTLRDWLNGAFLHEAFSETEQAALNSVENMIGLPDKVFLLSAKEARCYFNDTLGKDDSRISSPTELCAASSRMLTRSEYSAYTWWLRNVSDNDHRYELVGLEGEILQADVPREFNGVRPAIWVKL